MHDQTHRMTKQRALARFGVGDERRDRWIWQATELVHVAEGRCLLRKREFVRSMLVCVEGSAVAGTEARPVDLTGPFAIDVWCADELGRATMELTATTPCSLLLINVEHRDSVLERVRAISRLGASTVQLLLGGHIADDDEAVVQSVDEQPAVEMA